MALSTTYTVNPYAAQLSKDHKNSSLESDFPGRDSKTPFKLRIKSHLRPLNRNAVLTLHYLPLEKMLTYKRLPRVPSLYRAIL